MVVEASATLAGIAQVTRNPTRTLTFSFSIEAWLACQVISGDGTAATGAGDLDPWRQRIRGRPMAGRQGGDDAGFKRRTNWLRLCHAACLRGARTLLGGEAWRSSSAPCLAPQCSDYLSLPFGQQPDSRSLRIGQSGRSLPWQVSTSSCKESRRPTNSSIFWLSASI